MGKKSWQMTEEEKKAAAERMAKARAARKVTDKGVHESVKELPDDDPMSAKTIKSILQHNKDVLTSIKNYKNSKHWQERLEYQSVENYIKNLKDYLRTGVYKDMFYGKERNERMKYVCYAKAYDVDGCVKRTNLTWYDDMGLYIKDKYSVD